MRTLIVIKAHPYESRQREVDSEYQATDADARLLVMSGQARYKDAPQGGDDGQNYQTRAMTAAPSGARRPRSTKAVAA